MKLAEIDIKILDILQSNSKITNAQLALDIGISPSSMLERVKRLEQSEVISRYVALVNPEKIGKGMFAMVAVSLAVHRMHSVDTFKKSINSLAEVLECYHVSGEEDFMLKVAVKDMKAYENFVLNKLTKIKGINKIKTAFVLSTVKFKTKIELE